MQREGGDGGDEVVGERKNPALLLLTSGDAALRLRAASRMALRESMLWIVRAKEKQERGEEQSCGR